MPAAKNTIQEVKDALTEAYGFLSGAAEKLGVTRRTLESRIAHHVELQEHLKAVREKKLDFAEGMLMRLMREGNIAATIFYLKTQGKHRGYVERQELTGADGAIEIRVVRE
jgi:hypothetical protein